MKWTNTGRGMRDRGQTASKGDSCTSIWTAEINKDGILNYFRKAWVQNILNEHKMKSKERYKQIGFSFSAANLYKELVPLNIKICGCWNSRNMLLSGSKIWMGNIMQSNQFWF